MLSLLLHILLLYLIVGSLCNQNNRGEDGLLSDPVYLEGNQVIFIDQGTVANQIGFVHVKMVYNLKDVKETVEAALTQVSRIISEEKDYLEEQNNIANQAGKNSLSKANVQIGGAYLVAVENMQERIGDHYKSFNNMLVGLPNSAEENLASQNLRHRLQRHAGTMGEDEEIEREKRSVAVAGALALGGSIMAFLSLAQIQDLYRKFGNLQEGHNRLVDVSQAHENALSELRIDTNVLRDIIVNLSLRNGVIANAMSDRLVDYITRIENRIIGAIDCAQQQRLSFRAINGHTLLKLWSHLLGVAEREGFDIMLDHAMDLHQMDASYIYDYNTMEFILFVHVPMIPPGNKLTLYQFVPLPMIHAGMANATMIPDIGKKNYLALNAAREYRLMDTVDINACEKKGTLYLCSGRNVLYGDLGNTCLGSFYDKNETGVGKKCKFEFSDPEVLAFASGYRTWVIYTPHPGVASIRCRNRKIVLPPIIVKTQTSLRLKEGCSLVFERIHLSADENVEESLGILHVDWSGGKNLFDGLNAAYLEQRRKEIGNLGFSEPTAPRDLEYLKRFENFTGFSIINIIIFTCLGLLLFFVVVGAIIFFLKFRKQSLSQKTWVTESLVKRDDEVIRKATNSALEIFEKKVGEVKAPPQPPITNQKKFAPSAPPSSSGIETLRNRKLGKKLGMVSLSCATPVCRTAEAREQERLYPSLGGNPKTKCLLTKAIADRYKEHQFHCTFHDAKEGCTGIFLAKKPASRLSFEDILHDEINN